MSLELSHNSGGYRHRLDGRDVHCGDHLRMQLPDGKWIWARYEASIARWGISATLHTSVGVLIPNAAMVLRWPTEDEQ